MPTNETGAVDFKQEPPDVGRPRRRRSASWTPVSTSTTRRCRRPPPASARSSTGSPPPTRSLDGDGTWRADAHRGDRPDVHLRRRAPGPRRPAPTGSAAFCESHHRRRRRRRATSTATATPPTRGASSTTRSTARHLGRRRTTNDDFTDDAADAAVQREVDQIGHFGARKAATADLRLNTVHRRVPQRRPHGPLRRAVGRQDRRLRQHRPRGVRARHPRGRHHRRGRVCSAARMRRRGARRGRSSPSRACTWSGSCTSISPHRRHDRPGRQPPRRHRQHVHRRSSARSTTVPAPAPSSTRS